MSKTDKSHEHQYISHFITLNVVDWVDIFIRPVYKQIIVHSLNHFIATKGLNVYAWCLMSNHLHLVVSARNENLSDILRDFKKFTSKQIIEAIINNKQESRRDWMLKIFKEEGSKNSRNKEYQFWRQDNQPTELYSPKFVFQKINYIHNNPVESGIVEKAEDYLYSSAKDYHATRKCGLLDLEFL